MSYIPGLIIGFFLGLLADVVAPGLGSYLITLRDRLFLNKIYYDINISIITITKPFELTSKTLYIKPAGKAEDTYILEFIISCSQSLKVANFLGERFWIKFTLSGVEGAYFQPININENSPYPDWNKKTPNYIKFGPNDFKYPSDRAFRASISSSSNKNPLTVGFSYSLYKEKSRKEKESFRFRRKITVFNSIYTEADKDVINFKKL